MAKVLIVDDQNELAALLAALAIRFGHDARYCGTGTVALQIAREFEPDIAFVDISMPEMDGFELARKLRAQSAPALRIFAISGHAPNTWPKGDLHVFEQYLLKPVLSKTVSTILGDNSGFPPFADPADSADLM